MSVNQELIAEIAGGGHGTTYGRVHERNGHKDPSELLSWYWARPRGHGLSYVLTAGGYLILPTGFPGSRKGLDRELLKM